MSRGPHLQSQLLTFFRFGLFGRLHSKHLDTGTGSNKYISQRENHKTSSNKNFDCPIQLEYLVLVTFAKMAVALVPKLLCVVTRRLTA